MAAKEMPTRPTGNFSFTLAGIGEYVNARAFAEAMRDALDALAAVDQDLSRIDGGSIEWQVVEASTNSPLTMTMRSVPTGSVDYSQPVLDAFMDGIAEIDTLGTIPKNFPPAAVKAIKRFVDACAQTSKATFATLTQRYSPSQRFAKNISKLLESPRIVSATAERPDYVEEGILDGMVENLIGHQSLYFSLYEALNKERIKCFFSAELSELVRSAWMKRVAVEGRIRYSAEGTARDMRATSIRVKPGVGELPQFKGNFINITGGVESSRFVRGLRDDD